MANLSLTAHTVYDNEDEQERNKLFREMIVPV